MLVTQDVMLQAQDKASFSGQRLFPLLVNIVLRHDIVWEGWRGRDVEKHICGRQEEVTAVAYLGYIPFRQE